MELHADLVPVTGAELPRPLVRIVSHADPTTVRGIVVFRGQLDRVRVPRPPTC